MSIKPILIAALLTVSASAGHAGETDRSFYFARQDPFAGPEAATTNDIEIFGGVFASGTFGSIIKFWDTDYTGNFLIGGILGRDFNELGAGFVLGGVTGAAIRFGEDDDTTGEFWAGLRIRHHGLVIGDLAIAPGFTAGLSVVTGPTQIERGREIGHGGDATFLGFLGPEVAFRFRQAPNFEFVYQLHHRSGADGTFGKLGEGSNASTVGLRYRF